MPLAHTGRYATALGNGWHRLSALAVLAVANLGIRQKETLIARGQPVHVELAPVDFMRLSFRVAADGQALLVGLVGASLQPL